MSRHYKLTDETQEFRGRTLHRIEASVDLPHHGVRKGDRGGWVESVDNLTGNGWVSGNGLVTGNGWVSGNGLVTGNGWVSGNGLVTDYGRVSGFGQVSDHGQVFGFGQVSDHGQVFGYGQVSGDGLIEDPQDILTIGPIGSESVTITLHRTTTGHALHVGCWHGGTIDTLMAEVDSRAAEWVGDADDLVRWRAEYESLIPLLRLRANSFKAGSDE
ncbi:hypothetical protein QSJ18_18330 [Gordonia sp. ABSL1-1]|uniref:hypothetical protein n=1 Tax=Gordonia sp. ABSL1-1 TaxID=3053923 RepID=UPI002572DCA4|nr:hypothetical protein [Gordonia sp. ABSL1-1]MDL9938708.1 hypothetical protein [Gordonia sp. ABSL1-1]